MMMDTPTMREFASAAEMRAHYRDIRRRLFPPPPPSPPVAAEPCTLPPSPPACEPPPEPPKVRIEPPIVSPSVRLPSRAELRMIVLGVVARSFQTRPDHLLGPARTKPHVHGRWYCFHLVRQVGGIGLAPTGRMFGRDHTTVLSGLRKLDNMRDLDTGLQATLDEMEVEVRTLVAASMTRRIEAESAVQSERMNANSVESLP